MTDEAEKAKAYLQHLQILESAVTDAAERYEEIRAKADGLSGKDYSAPPVHGSPNSDIIPNQIALIEQAAELYRERLEEYGKYRYHLIMLIMKLDNAKYIDILMRRYILGQLFERIEADMELSHKHVFRIHNAALESFADIME